MTPDIREKAERLLDGLGAFQTATREHKIGAISQALLESHNAGRAEMAARMNPARIYFERYCQDEADDAENCICGEQQHEDAKAFATAIRSIK